ncbi:hypothetical protein DFH11DRAFT_1515250 [Phellopilus nigrolimitatus]|nr:hypothetical protein DFH11DRAFT_1515250 [Phellopilus nigrolimitatus]
MHSIRSDIDPVDPSLVPLFITNIDIKQYTLVAILTLLVYDNLLRLTLNFIYRCKHPDTTFQSLLIILKGLGFVWIQDILLIRVLALYHQDKRLGACLRTLFGLEAVFLLGIIIYNPIHEEYIVGELDEGVTFCENSINPPKVWNSLSWLVLVAAPMLYETILMVLALYKAAEHWRETAGFNQFALVKVLVQDQAIYFIMVIFCSVVEIIAYQLFIPNVFLANLLNVLGNPSLLCILGSHLHQEKPKCYILN